MNRLRELREAKKYTLDDIEKKTGINRGTYNNYESGKTSPKEPTWQALADFFDVSVPYLKGYMVCTRCKGYFISESDVIRENIKCCPYCMNPYFEGDKE
ncbi:helix-turn-helix domain-containing protein [Lactobacillus helveticus]|uniref:helix-turn-helix domain-containing protein n=1 Tax=Lactobacillus helveticus TaxID=1587 RepID=UPI00156663F4|nr:helix-turn-helix transcriptional regulator [Lactobacillus helveticus]NRO59210.1 HTH-type transcriptional regulator Xre [Lactobacillus helveticus]